MNEKNCIKRYLINFLEKTDLDIAMRERAYEMGLREGFKRRKDKMFAYSDFQMRELQSQLEQKDTRIAELEQSLKTIYSYSIFMSRCYQKNFEEFADYCPEPPLLKMSDKEKKYYHSIAERVSTVQGFALRQEVKSISKDRMPIENMKLSDLKTARETLKQIGETE